MADVTLRARLSEWCGVEGAMAILAEVLGLMTAAQVASTEHKYVFASANPLGDFLYATLERMAELGYLEREDREHDLCFRANPRYELASDRSA